MQKLKKFMLIFATIVFLFGAGTVAFLIYASYSDGYRVGTIAKISHKGFILKTWEGELSQGFLDSDPNNGATSGVATRVWYFSVDGDRAVLSAIDKAITEGHRVKLYYKEKYVTLPWVGDTVYVVYKVEQIQ